MRPQRLGRGDLYSIAALAGFTITLLSTYLLTTPTPLIYPESPLGTDLPREIWPLAHYMKQAIVEEGSFPLWRPYLLSGAPIAGHPISPVFYPVHWLVLLLPIPLALNLDIALHLLWMAIGTYLYLRVEAGVRPRAALFGAMVFALTPKWIAHISGGHLPMISAISWWPWIWLGWRQYLSSSRTGWAVFMGIGLAGQIMNDGRFVVITLFALAVLSMVKLIRASQPMWSQLFRAWTVTLTVGLGLSAVQLFPFLELLVHSTRTAIDRQGAAFGSLPIPLTLNIFFPPDLKFPEWYLYPGVGALGLALVGAMLNWGHRERWAFAGFLTGLLLSYGSNTPLFEVMYELIPGYSLLRVPSRWWLISLSSLAILAAGGMEKWLSGDRFAHRRLRLVPFGLAFFYMFVAAADSLLGISVGYSVLVPALLMVSVLFIVNLPPSAISWLALLMLAFADVWVTGEALLRPESFVQRQEPSAIVSSLQEGAHHGERSFAPYGGLEMADLARFGLLAADGYDSFATKAYADLATYSTGCEYFEYSAAIPTTAGSPAALRACPEFIPRMDVLALLNVRYILLPHPVSILESNLKLESNGLWLYELSPGLGRAHGVAESLMVLPGRCPQILAEIDVKTQAVVEVKDLVISATRSPEVISSRRMINREDFWVEVAEPGLLIRSEAWAPGWTAEVDGRSAEVQRVDCALQGVLLQPGDSLVSFQYEPVGFVTGLVLTLASCFLLGIGLLIWQKQNKNCSKGD